MKLLVKLGGTLVDDPESKRALSRELAGLSSSGHQAVVVHGGGKQMTRYLADRGVESRFVNGLRVTGPEVVDALLKVFAGSVNKELVSALIGAGARAVGLSGVDARLAEATQLDPELGAVGRIQKVNPEILQVLVDHSFLPVVACVAGSPEGSVFNVNADQMAVACASAWQAETLLFLTDVNGVRDANGQVLPRLTSAEAHRLIAAGVATGGMQAKLESACLALEQGVDQVVIAPGAEPAVIGRFLEGEALGTRMILGGETAS